MGVNQDGDMRCARGIWQDIFTQAQTADELFRNIEEKVALHFEDNRGSPGIDILVVSELNAPAATS
jgi:hypothetical protein